MKIVILTTDDPLYLPDFFERVFSRMPPGCEIAGVYVAPPLYKNETVGGALRKYYRTFGFADSTRLAAQVFGCKLKRQSIAATCRAFYVRCEHAADVNASGFLSELRCLSPDVIVSVSCPQIFKKALIGLAPKGILNIHGAILPQYRGVMPSFWMMANGEKKAGVSIYFVNEQIDAGELCAQKIFDIYPQESLDQFIRRSKTIAADLLSCVLNQLRAGQIERRSLDLAEGSYFSWPDAAAVSRFRAAGRQLW